MISALSFHDADAVSVGLTGGKGSSLARLAQAGFHVPPGFVVTAGSYHAFVAEARRAGLFPAVWPIEDPARIGDLAETVRAGLLALPLPPDLSSAVAAQWAGLPPGGTVAVRSSSTMEDLEGAAFAGQHDTFLNIRTLDEVSEKIRACFASLWNARAIAYRAQHGFDHTQASMAVVVQAMVPSEVAGVAFSINPVSGRLDEVVVDANFGLGESVVGGECEVDHFEIDKATHAVRVARLGHKSHRIVPTTTGTGLVEVTEAEAARPSLTDGQLGDLARLALAVEAWAGFPQDLEWALAEGQFFLLQARPVTIVPPRWTRDESAERFPNPITPLTWDFVEAGFHASLTHSLRLMGLPPFNGQWFAQHDHWIYGNQNAVALYAGRLPFRARTLAEVEAILPRLRTDYRWVQELPVHWIRDLDSYLITVGRFLAEPVEAMDESALWNYVQRVVDHGAVYFQPNLAISLTHGLLYRWLHETLTEVAGASEAARLFDGLLAWCDTKTSQINRELFDLAQRLRAVPALETLVRETPSREILHARRLSAFPSFAARFDRFLADHGHRETDFDPWQPPWAEAPWVVLDTVRLILASPPGPTPAEKEREAKVLAQQSEFELLQRVPTRFQFFFHEIIRLARVYTALDDLEHYQTTRLNQPLRRGLLELGRRLVARGLLGEPSDVFFARRTQITEAAAHHTDDAWRNLGRLIESQRTAYFTAAAHPPEWEIGGAGPLMPAESDIEALSGIPGSPGTAEGEVFVVRGTEDFARFPKGAVLVARTTNPAWTPLFYSACAVITESGGPLSHGAVTAREIRLPAVMSVRDCLQQLTNGQRVRVDGTAGRVLRLSRPEAEGNRVNPPPPRGGE